MAELQEEIDKILKNVQKKVTPEEFTKIKNGITRHFEGGEPAWSSFGLSKDMLEELYLIAYNQYNGGRYEDAKKIFFLLEFLDEKDIRFRYSIAACYQMEKKYWEAVLKYSECLVLFEGSPLIYYHLADCYLNLKEPGQAASMLVGCIRTIGNNRTYDPLKFRAEQLYETLKKEYTEKEVTQ